MSIDRVSDNRVVTGSDGGRSAANLNYILYIVGFVTGITALIGVALAYSNRDTASESMRTHFDWQIKIFWRSVKFWIVMSILYVLFTFIAVLTLGLGFILYLIPFGIWIWWLVSTIRRVAVGMKALGLGQPVGFHGGGVPGNVGPVPPSGAAAVAPVASLPSEGWYDDTARAGHKRWWDGAAWGMRDDEHPSVAGESSRPEAAIATTSDEVRASPIATAVARAENVPAAGPSVDALAESTPASGPGEAAVTVVAEGTESAAVAASPSVSGPASAVATRFCENCGAERRPGGRFCTSCGHA